MNASAFRNKYSHPEHSLCLDMVSTLTYKNLKIKPNHNPPNEHILEQC